MKPVIATLVAASALICAFASPPAASATPPLSGLEKRNVSMHKDTMRIVFSYRLLSSQDMKAKNGSYVIDPDSKAITAVKRLDAIPGIKGVGIEQAYTFMLVRTDTVSWESLSLKIGKILDELYPIQQTSKL